MRRWTIALVAGVSVGVALTIPSRSGGQDRSPSAAEHDFGSKVVLITMRSDEGLAERSGGHMEQVKVRRLGDRHFLVGRSPVGGWTSRYPQTTVWVPLSEVVGIVEYDNLEDAKKDFEARRAEQGQEQPG